MLQANSFNGGTNSATITTGNSGGASGNAWDLVGGSTLPVYSTTNADGPRAPMVANFAAGAGQLEWTVPALAARTIYLRTYIRIAANPSSEGVAAYTATPTSDTICLVNITAAGKVKLANGGFGAHVTTTASIALAQWVRIEARFTIGTTTSNGAVDLRLYNDADSPTPTETQSATGRNLGTELPGRLGLFGLNVASQVDDLAMSDVDWIGPAGGGFIPRPIIANPLNAVRRAAFY